MYNRCRVKWNEHRRDTNIIKTKQRSMSYKSTFDDSSSVIRRYNEENGTRGLNIYRKNENHHHSLTLNNTNEMRV